MVFEGSPIAPARMHEELVGVAYRLKGVIVETSRFTACWTLDVVDGMPQFVPITVASVESGKWEWFHLAYLAVRPRVAGIRRRGEVASSQSWSR